MLIGNGLYSFIVTFGLISFIVIFAITIVTLIAGIVILVSFKRGINIIRIIGIILIISSILAIPLSCRLCFTNPKTKQKVNVDPIIKLEMPAHIKSVKEQLKSIDTFELYEVVVENGKNKNGVIRTDGIIEMVEGVDSEGTYIEIIVDVFDNIENARESYDHKFLGKESYGIMESGGKNNNRYFVTYINQLRSDLEGCCVLMDDYQSYVVFQKNNIVITLQEATSEKTKSRKDMYIKLLADKLVE